ncbi:MAG: cupredoxin domain-containing protein [Chloroflexi bacterium]|nr:cupredoxin domain-containing protein [Chloroflexota bacterium]
MTHARHLVPLLLAVVVGASAAACVTATPGWTYAPAPSVTPPPSAAASGSAGSPAPSEAAGGVQISALNVAFEQTAVTAPAGKAFQIAFDNKDAGTPHNVAIHKDSATGAEVFKGEIVTGPATRTYDVPALDAGTYAFVCTVHPNMTGTLTVQ